MEYSDKKINDGPASLPNEVDPKDRVLASQSREQQVEAIRQWQEQQPDRDSNDNKVEFGGGGGFEFDESANNGADDGFSIAPTGTGTKSLHLG